MLLPLGEAAFHGFLLLLVGLPLSVRVRRQQIHGTDPHQEERLHEVLGEPLVDLAPMRELFRVLGLNGLCHRRINHVVDNRLNPFGDLAADPAPRRKGVILHPPGVSLLLECGLVSRRALHHRMKRLPIRVAQSLSRLQLIQLGGERRVGILPLFRRVLCISFFLFKTAGRKIKPFHGAGIQRIDALTAGVIQRRSRGELPDPLPTDHTQRSNQDDENTKPERHFR